MSLRFGGQYFYMEAVEEGVIIMDNNVRLIGANNVNEKFVPYSEITSVRYACTGGLLPIVELELIFPGNTFVHEPGKRIRGPFQVNASGKKYIEQAKVMKSYIEERVRQSRR